MLPRESNDLHESRRLPGLAGARYSIPRSCRVPYLLAVAHATTLWTTTHQRGITRWIAVRTGSRGLSLPGGRRQTHRSMAVMQAAIFAVAHDLPF